MTESTTTMTAVKTKTVTRTQMAVALACLGASIIAAAAMSIAGNNASNICVSNAKIKVTLTLGQGELVNACKGQLIVSTPKFSQLLVRNYNDEVLTLLVDKKYVTFKVGEDYKPVGKPIGDVPGYQQNLYVAYSGKVDKKADINLFYGYPTGEKGVFCSDTDESQQNYDKSSIKDFKFVNPYVKGTISSYDEETDEMIPTEDVCADYSYGYGVASTTSNMLAEYYCSTANGGSWLSTSITCEGGCVDGACVPVVASSTPPVVEPVTPSSTLPMATSTLVCTDSDNGIDYYTKGHLVGEMFQGVGQTTYHLDSNDACTDATRLSEYYCYKVGESIDLKGIVSGAIKGGVNGTSYGVWGTYDCAKEGKVCKEGVCTSTVATGKMNFSVSQLSSNKLVNGYQTLGIINLSALDEDISLDSLKFTINVTSGGSSTTTVSSLQVFVPNYWSGTPPGGYTSFMADETIAGKYYVVFSDDLNFILPKYLQSLVDWQKSVKLVGVVNGVGSGSSVIITVNPAKDIIGTGTKSGQKISPATDKSTIISTLVY